jgi:hypothetical protein
MPHATLTFDLAEERHAHLCALHGEQYREALAEVYEVINRVVSGQEHDRSALVLAERLKRIIAARMAGQLFGAW